jgi:hypothetical protein
MIGKSIEYLASIGSLSNLASFALLMMACNKSAARTNNRGDKGPLA